MHKEPRSSAGRVCVIHVNVGPERDKSAENLVKNVLNVNGDDGGGYHWVFDNTTSIRVANDNEEVWGAKGGTANATGLHYCIIGEATQTAAEWMDGYSQAAMARCAAQVAADCKAKNIQTIRVAGKYGGICGHGDVTVAFRVAGGHTDPGPNFPWEYFLGLVRTLHLTQEDDLPLNDADKKWIQDTVHDVVGAWLRSQDGDVKARRVEAAKDGAGQALDERKP